MASGINSDDLDEFLNKVDAATKTVRALAEGHLNPEDVDTMEAGKLPTKLRLEEEERRRREEEARLEEEARKRVEAANAQKAEEREKWWKMAKFRFGDFSDEEGEEEEEEEEAKRTEGGKKGMVVKQSGDSLRSGPVRDWLGEKYAKWDRWLENPDDPATAEEREELERLQEKVKDEAFEKANPEFCAQFRGDLKERQEREAKRQKDADFHRSRGNGLFRKGKIDEAEREYRAALALHSLDTAILQNLSAAALKLEQLEEALDFAKRAVYVAEHTGAPLGKALFRRSKALEAVGDFKGAVADLERAVKLDGTNEALALALSEMRGREMEARVAGVRSEMLEGSVGRLIEAVNSGRGVKKAVDSVWEDLEKEYEATGMAIGSVLEALVGNKDRLKKGGADVQGLVRRASRLDSVRRNLATWIGPMLEVDDLKILVETAFTVCVACGADDLTTPVEAGEKMVRRQAAKHASGAIRRMLEPTSGGNATLHMQLVEQGARLLCTVVRKRPQDDDCVSIDVWPASEREQTVQALARAAAGQVVVCMADISIADADSMKFVLRALHHLSLCVSARSAFATVARPLVDAACLDMPPEATHARGTLLAALSNACLDTPAVPSALASTDASSKLFRLMDSQLTAQPLLADRAARLLSRLVQLASPDSFDPKTVVHCLRRAAESVRPAPPTERYVAGESIESMSRRHVAILVNSLSTTPRTSDEQTHPSIAAVIDTSIKTAAAIAKSSPATAHHLFENDIVTALGIALSSATQSTAVTRTRLVGIGNAAALVIALLAVEASKDTLPEHLLRVGIVDTFVQAVKDAGETPAAQSARKNCAVALAKIAAFPPARQRLREVNGTSVLLQLQNKL